MGSYEAIRPEAVTDLHGDMVVVPYDKYDPGHLLAMGPYTEGTAFPVMNVANWGGGRKLFGYFPVCAECIPVNRAGRFVVPVSYEPQAGGLSYLYVRALCWEHAKGHVGLLAWPRPLIHIGHATSARELCFEPWEGLPSPTTIPVPPSTEPNATRRELANMRGAVFSPL